MPGISGIIAGPAAAGGAADRAGFARGGAALRCGTGFGAAGIGIVMPGICATDGTAADKAADSRTILTPVER